MTHDKATAAKYAAIAQVERNADEEWFRDALAALYAVAKSRYELTADDVWSTGISKPREPRAMGALFSYASKDGVITPTNEHRLSIRSTCHRRPLRVWISNIRQRAA